MIREATVEDIPRLVEMGKAFHAEKQKLYPFVADDTAAFFKGMIAGGAVFISGGGFIAGVIIGAPSNQSYRTAYETFWWASDGSGQRLRRAFENWAKGEGCADVIFSHPPNEAKVHKMLERVGYEDSGQMMRRPLKCA